MPSLERVRNSQFFVAATGALVTGLYLFLRYPLAMGEPGLVLLRLKAPSVYLFFRVTYVVFMFTTPLIVYSALLSFFFVHLYRRDDGANRGELPPYERPEERNDLYVVLGEVHHPTEKKRSPSPSWLRIPEKGLYTGIACFGAIGSGKTSSLIRPLASQLFAFASKDPGRRIGGIVLEVKGDFCHQVKAILDAAGRGEDYREISLDTRYRYNPLANPDLDEDALAYAITTLIANIYGKGKDPFWPMASTNAMKFLILLHRLLDDYVTLTDIYHAAIDPGLLQKRLDAARKRYGIEQVLTVSTDSYGKHTELLRQSFVEDPEDGARLRAPWSAPLEASLAKNHVSFEVKRLHSGDADPTKREQLEAVERWYRSDWTAIDVKLRTSIVEGISVFLSLFDTNPALKTIFCPPKAVFDAEKNRKEDGYPLGEPFPPFADLIEKGRVVALNFPVSLNPTVAKTIGTLMKLDYQRAVLLRIPRMAAAEEAERKGGPKVHFRPTVFLVDEYQNFFALSRQPKCIAVVATQSVVSLKSALSSDDAYKTLLQTFRSTVFLTSKDDLTAKYGAELCGKEDRIQASYNVSESTQDAKVSFLDGRTAGSRSSVSTSKSYQVRQQERFPVKAFYSLKNAQAIAVCFDGVNPIPTSYCYLKPYWLPVEQSWWDQYEKGLLG